MIVDSFAGGGVASSCIERPKDDYVSQEPTSTFLNDLVGVSTGAL